MESLTRNNYYEKSAFLLLAVAVATLPFTRFLMLPIALLMLVLFVTSNFFQSQFKTLTNNHLLPPFCITLSIFLLSLIGTAYSTNMGKAISDWECKLWFLAAPLCILPLYGKMSLERIKILLIVFCLSVTATAIGNFVISTAKFAQSGDTSQFFYIHATHFIGNKPTHPSYLSMYCALAWVISVIMLAEKKVRSRPVRWALATSLPVLPAEIFVLQSKAGILVFAAVFVGTAIHIMRKREIPLWAGLLLLACCIVAGGLVTSDKMPLTNRLSDMRQLEHAGELTNPYNGTLQRIAVWRTSCELAADNLPFGTGTGDLTDELCKRYETKGYTYILDKRLNCHNQYLQHLAGLGIPGILALLLFIGLPLWEAIKQKDFLQGVGFLIFAGNLLVESMLETRAGSNFIPLMTMLLLLHGRARQSAEETRQNSQ